MLSPGSTRRMAMRQSTRRSRVYGRGGEAVAKDGFWRAPEEGEGEHEDRRGGEAGVDLMGRDEAGAPYSTYMDARDSGAVMTSYKQDIALPISVSAVEILGSTFFMEDDQAVQYVVPMGGLETGSQRARCNGAVLPKLLV
jgi:hypothetical protein